MNLEDYESRRGKSRHIEVKINCEYCSNEKWVRWIRVKKGQGRFCSLKCANLFQLDEAKESWGKENAHFHWDESRQCWYAYWRDKETGNQKSTTKARWLWEINVGNISNIQVVTYIDGNSKNCELDNLKIISRSESNAIHLIGHVVSDETKQKISKAHSGKKLSGDHKRRIGNSVRRRWEEGEFESIHVGENNPRWKGGIKFLVYPKEFDEKLKRRIRRRDSHECQCCNKNVYRSRYGHVHHIDGNKQNNSDDNLILVCASCHNAIHDKKNITSDKILEYRSKLK